MDEVGPHLRTVVTVLDLVGILVFAVSGGLVAVRKSLDIVGVVVLAVTTGLGGGLIRDVLIGAEPPAALSDWRYLAVPVAGGLLTFWFHPTFGRMERVVNVFDAVGLGTFCVAGASKALVFGLGPLPAALMGVVTAVGGGILRDVLAGRVPIVLRSRELYAIPALAGAAITVLGDVAGVRAALVAVPAALVCTGWRLLALSRGWTAPTPSGPAST